MGKDTANFWERGFERLCLSATLICLAGFLALVIGVCRYGLTRLDWQFLTQIPSPDPATAGIGVALAGSAWLVGLTALFVIPIGVGTAIYLEEYARPGPWKNIIQTNIANLAGVPSIVYGILGLAVFVRGFGLGRSVLAGALTLALVVLPIVIIAAQEALRAVPSSLRDASYALGATRWQTVRHQVFPVALPSILTGVILALSRALGEAAPLLVVGAAAFASFSPTSLLDDFSAVPVQIFGWATRPQQEFQQVAAAAVLVLLVALIGLNGVALLIGRRLGNRVGSS